MDFPDLDRQYFKDVLDSYYIGHAQRRFVLGSGSDEPGVATSNGVMDVCPLVPDRPTGDFKTLSSVLLIVLSPVFLPVLDLKPRWDVRSCLPRIFFLLSVLAMRFPFRSACS